MLLLRSGIVLRTVIFALRRVILPTAVVDDEDGMVNEIKFK